MDRRNFTRSLIRLGAAGVGTIMSAGMASAAQTKEAVMELTPLWGGSIVDVPGNKLSHHTLSNRPAGFLLLPT